MIQLHDVSRRFRLGTQTVCALDRVSLEIPDALFVAVVGRSGAGKSTLLHLLAAMDRPDAGEIRVGDWDLLRLDRRALARYRATQVGMIFQQFNLVASMDALANVALPLVLQGVDPAARRERAVAQLHRVGLEIRMHHRPAELSGGEQQRVAIARALVNDPQVILADEPTGNLDSHTARDILDLLVRVRAEAQKTILLVTHNAEDAHRVADRILYIEDGQIVRDVSNIPEPATGP